MKTENKSTNSICLAVISAILAASAPGPASGQLISSMSAKTPLQAVTVISEQKSLQSGKALQDWYFDGKRSGGFKDVIPVTAVSGAKENTSAAKYPVSQPKSLKDGKTPPPVNKDKISSKPGVIQSGLDKLKTTADGNIYKLSNENPWWKIWASERSVQKASPDEEGKMWNSKGEFVGSWKTVMKTAAGDFQVTKGQDGQDHIYTVRNDGGIFTYNREIYRDGVLAASFPSSFDRHSITGEVKAGADDKTYAKYAQKKTEDAILTPDPASGKLKTAARIPVEYREWTEHHTRRVSHTDSKGRTTYTTEHYTDHHEERKDVSKFEVTPDGRVFTLFKGNVFEDGPDADRKPLTGNGFAYVPGKKVPAGNVRDFKIDSNGNLYTLTSWSNKVLVNNKETNLDLGWQGLNIDDSGNVYRTESAGWFKGDYLKAVNVLSDPADASAAVK